MTLLLQFLSILTLFRVVSIDAAQNSLHASSRVIVAKNGQKFLVSYVHFEQMRNKRLLVKPISVVIASNHQECRQSCLKTSGCVSMNVKNFNATYVGCELLDEDHFQKRRLFIDYIGFDYYVVNSDCFTGNKTCPNNQICSVNYTSGSSTCKCRKDGTECHTKDFNPSEKDFVLDDYEFVPPNWRISFSIKFIQFTTQMCKVFGVIQKINANNVRYDGDHGKRQPAIFVNDNGLFISIANSKDNPHKLLTFPTELNKVYNVTVQQIFKERVNEQLIWTYSLIVNGVEKMTQSHDDSKQFYGMELQVGKGEGADLGCNAQVENLHHELLDIANPLVAGFKFTTLEELREEWLLAVDIKPNDTKPELQNIITMETQSGFVVCKISFRPDETRMKIKTAVNGTTKMISAMTSYDSLPLEQYSTFKLFHIYDKIKEAYVVEIVINGILYGTTVNTVPTTFKDVAVYTSGQANADIKGLYILNI